MMTNELTAAGRILDGLCSDAERAELLVAVSGGLDSMCLLHFAAAWGAERNVKVAAAHFNHQLRSETADRDEAFVRNWCAAHNIPFVCGRGDVRSCAAADGLSIEEAARRLRYAFLERERQRGGYTFILTAHHADDNAETMLLNLLRGTGLRGLTGIPAQRDQIVRPLLQSTRMELEAYAKTHGIPHVEDETNQLDDATRNVLRHKVLPVLRELNPRAVENMSRTAELLKRDEAALESAAAAVLQAACQSPGECAEVSADAFQGHPAAVTSRAVWHLLCSVSGQQKDISAAHVEAVCSLLSGTDGQEISLPYAMTACREREKLVIRKQLQLPEQVKIAIGQTVHFGSWSVTVHRGSEGMELALPADAELTVTSWRREDRMALPGSRGERSFKRLCSDVGIPPWKREQLPVLRVGKQAAAVPGLGIHSEFLPDSERETVRVIFHQETEEKRYEK